jgi:hypothetical protein
MNGEREGKKGVNHRGKIQKIGKLKERIKEARDMENKEHKEQVDRSKHGNETKNREYRCPSA